MVSVLMMRMRLSVLRHSMNGARAALMVLEAIVGLLAAMGTIWLGVLAVHNPAFSLDLLSLAFLCWMIGWIVGPLLNSGDETLRVEQFRLLPLSPRQLAAGLLGASCLGVGPAATLVALCALVVYAAPFGILPTLIAILALLLQWICTMLLSHVVIEALHSPTRSRLATELAALLLGLLLGLAFTGWMLLPLISSLGHLFESQPSPFFSTLMQLLPSGWGPVAVNAASNSDWPRAAGAITALLLLGCFLLFLWSRLLNRRMTTVARLPRTTTTLSLLPRLLPASPLWAVVSKELSTWFRDPWRARFLRMGLWVSLFSCVLPVFSGWFFMLPWMGAIMILIVGIPAGNLYAFDGSSLWLGLVIPDIARFDVRGRQIAWLLLIAPVALLLTVVFTLVSKQDWAWTWVLAIIPALLGGTAGLLPLISVFLLVPLTEPGKRGGSPMVTGPDNGRVTLQMRLMLILIVLMAVPASLTVLAGVLLHLLLLQWLGVVVGLSTGLLCSWWFGHVAYQRLEERGPELLNAMRHGTSAQVSQQKQTKQEGVDLPRGKSFVVGFLILFGILFTLPQGIVSLILKLTNVHTRGWFIALYLPSWLQIPATLICLLLGLALLLGAGSILRKHRKTQRQEVSTV